MAISHGRLEGGLPMLRPFRQTAELLILLLISLAGFGLLARRLQVPEPIDSREVNIVTDAALARPLDQTQQRGTFSYTGSAPDQNDYSGVSFDLGTSVGTS